MFFHRCRTQDAFGKCESSLESTHTEAFQSSSCKPSRDCIWLPHKSLQKHSEWFHMCTNTAQCQCNVTVLTSLQTSGDPQAFSYKTRLKSGAFPDHSTIFTLHNIYNNHISLLTVTHRGVSPGGMWSWRVFITDLCVRLHTDRAKLLQRDGGALR